MEFFWLPFAMAFAFPARWGLRIGVVAALTGAALICLSPATPFEEMGGFEGLGTAILIFLFLGILLGITVRLAAELLYHRPILCPGNRLLRWADQLLSLSAGVLAGTLTTLWLAITLRGQSGGLLLHFVVSAGGVALAVACLKWTAGLKRWFAATLCITIAALVLWGGLFYPRLIEREALLVSPGIDRCLRAPGAVSPKPDELRLLTLPKALFTESGLTLTVMLAERPKHYRWSYRSMGFRPYNSYPHGACPPVPALP